ncbi:MAG TPA: hypothetical protein VF707_15475 [Ardenticatenaceae bacterium]|jgi:hypothetical protein
MASRLVVRLLWGVAYAALLLFLLFFAFRAWNVLLFPHQVEYGEGPVLDWARQMANGTLPYKPIASFPWNFSVYSPGYMAGAALFLRLLPDAPWFGGRFLSFGSAVALAFLAVAALSTRNEKGGAGVWLAAGLWLASPYVFRWGTFYRPDLLALLWSALGIVLAQRAIAREQAGLVALAALCFVLSFWTKQSFFAAPLAALVYLFIARREWLPRFVLTGGVAGAAIGGLLWAATGGALVDNLIAANANPFSWHALWTLERSFWVTAPVLLVLLVWQVARAPSSLLALCGLLSLLVTVSAGKAGATENYFLEPLWVACVLAGQALGEWSRVDGWRRLAAPALVLLQLTLFVPGFERRTPAAELAWLQELRAENVALHETLESLPPDATVWSEQMGVLAEMGRAVLLHSFVYTQLEREGLWDSAPLVEALESGDAPLLIQRFDAVADPLARDRWSRAMLDASERGYALGERAGRWLHRPPLPFPAAGEVLDFGGGVSLVNWMVVGTTGRIAAPVALRAGEEMEIHLLWRSEARDATPLTASVQLFAPDGTRMAQNDFSLRGGMLGGAWPAGALVRDEHALSLTETLPSGAYTVLVSLYESKTGAPRGSATLSGFKVSPPPPESTLPSQRDLAFGEEETLSLMGLDVLPTEIAAGETLALRAHWRVEKAVPRPLTTFLHLIAPDGTLVAQTDFAPTYPTTLWSAGEVVELSYNLTLPEALPSGSYEVLLGWYDAETLQRLPTQADQSLDGALMLGRVEVR